MASRPPENAPDPARGRFMVMSVMRLTGALLVILGMLLTQDAIDLAGEVNMVIGYIFIVVGLAELFVMPRLFARKWRSPPQ